MEREVAAFLLELASRNASPHTITAYKSDLARFVAWLGSQAPPVVDITTITSASCLGFVISMRERGFASATVARRYAAVRTWIHWLTLRRQIQAIEIPRYVKRDPSPLPRVPGPDAVAAMIGTCDRTSYCGARDRAVLEFAYSTGCRAAEVCGLRMGDVALDRRSARVIGKGRKERVVAIGGSARVALRVYLDEWRRPARDPQSAGLVFLTRDDTALSTRNLHKLVARAALAARVGDVHPHTLRHAFATHLVDNGANLVAVKDMLGHASLASTQLYVQLAPGRVLAAHEFHPRHESGPQAEGPTGREGEEGAG
jgi:site-specific recombinase XerD